MSIRVSHILLILALAGSALSTPSIAQDALRALDLAEQAYIDGDYRAVIKHTNEALRADPTMHDAYFLRGAAHWKLGLRSPALDDLRIYTSTGGDFSEEARVLLSQLSVPHAKDLRYEVRTGILYSDRVVRPNKPIDDPDRESEDIGARFGWFVETRSHEWLSLVYRGAHLQYFDVTEASWHNEALDAVGRWYNDGGTASIEARLGGEYVRRDDGPDVWRGRTRTDFTWAFRPHRHIGWVGIELGHDRYPADDAFSGDSWLFNAGMEHYLSAITLFWDAYILTHDARDSSLSFTENGGRIGLVCALADTVSAGASVRALIADFDRYERVFGMDRSDDYYSADLWTRIRLSGAWTLKPFVEYTTNASSFDSLDFDRMILGIDLSLDVL